MLTMRFNEREASDVLNGNVDLEGRLNFRKHYVGSYSQSAFKERWFKLKNNLLFYFRISDTGKVDEKQPSGLFILEHCNIQSEGNSGIPFAFSITFRDEPDRKLIFSGRSEDHVQQWISALKKSSYEYWRQQMILLQAKIRLLTGEDPLLLYPHNQGFVRNFEGYNDSNAIGLQKSTFQSHILAASTAAISLNSSTAAAPLSRSASSACAMVESVVPPPRMNALSKSASSHQANRHLSPPPRASRSQFHRPISPLAQKPSPTCLKTKTEGQESVSNGTCVDESPNLIEL